MGEWFARSVGICWVETLRMLAVSVGFGGLEGLDGSLVECAPGGIAVRDQNSWIRVPDCHPR